MAKDSQARHFVAALDFEHLRELELREPRMGEVERDRDAGHAVRREPVIRQPVARTELQAERFQLLGDGGNAVFELGALDADAAEVAHAHLEQLVVGQRGPVGRLQLVIGGCCFHHSVSRS